MVMRVVMRFSYLTVRLKRSGIVVQWRKKARQLMDKLSSDNESPFYEIVDCVEKQVASRDRGETIKHWARRLGNAKGLDSSSLST